MSTDLGVAGSCEEEAREVEHLDEIRNPERQHSLQRRETSFSTRDRHLTAGVPRHFFLKRKQKLETRALALEVGAKQRDVYAV